MKRILPAFAVTAFALSSSQALAHTGLGAHGSFLAGLAHPLTGLDHMLAMLAVGLWAAQKGGKAVWVWPLAFVGVMIAGGLSGMTGLALPMVEPGILASIVVLGLMVTFAVNIPVGAGAALVAAFAFLHGYAHGTDAAGAHALAYASGFASTTVALHIAGLVAGLAANRLVGPLVVRAIGATTIALGFGLALAG